MTTGYKQTSIGSMPAEWDVVKLKDFVTIETGKRAKGGALDIGNVASIGGEHIDRQGNIQWDNMKFIPENFYGLLKQGKVKLGDILLVKDGATTGKVAKARNLKYDKVAVNEHVFIIRSKTNRLANEYLFHFLFSSVGQNQIKRRFHGMIGGITRNDLRTIFVPLPLIEEQRRIAEVLSCVDDVIRKVGEAFAETERLKKGLMLKLLTEGVGHKEFKETKIGKIPKAWKVTRLGDIAKLKSGGTPSRKKPEYWSGKIPWVKSGELNDAGIYNTKEKITELGLKESSAEIFPKGTLLIALYGKGTVSRTAILGIDAASNQAVGAIIPRKNSFWPEYMQYCLIFFRRKMLNQLVNPSSDVGRTNIYLNMLKLFKVPIPPLLEQQKIAKILSTIDKKLELNKERKKNFERIKRGLMRGLLTGKRRVRAVM